MKIRQRRSSALFMILSVILMIAALFPSVGFANDRQSKVVRVAYVITPGYQEGREGEHKNGYGYEYLQRLARINGWRYEYVYGSFKELLTKLENGEVDLMGNLSYTEERAERFSYGEYEQGKENFYLYINRNAGAKEYTDISSVYGMKIGYCNGKTTEEEWKTWCRKQNIAYEMIGYDYFEDCRNALNDGEIDALIEGMIQLDETTIDWEAPFTFASKPFYFGVNKDRPDLLDELNQAQEQILDENPFFNEKVQDRYLKQISLATTNLNDDEKCWLINNGKNIKFGYLVGFPPLSYQDETGAFKGLAADLLDTIEQKYASEKIEFEPVAFDDYYAMFQALNEGEIQVAWPAYDDFWSAEQRGFTVTDQIVDTAMMLVYDGKYTEDTLSKIGVINTGSLPRIYAEIHYPKSEISEYDSYEKAIDAILSGEVSSVLYVSTTYNVDVLKNETLQKMNMVTLPDSFGISFAVAADNDDLISILEKGIAIFGESGVNHSLITNSSVEQDITLKVYFEKHPYYLVLLTVFILAVIAGIAVFIIYKNMSVRVKTSQAEKEMFEQISNSDPLTGLYNRKAVFAKCCELLDQYTEEQFVMVHLDMKHFRLYNTFFGDAAGDKLLCDVADLLRSMSPDYDHWAYGRIEADVFCAFFPYEEKKYQKHITMALDYLRKYRDDYLIELIIGMYFVTDRDMPIEAMFTRATLAAKEVTPNTPFATAVYKEKMEKELNDNQHIINEMQTAIEQKQFKVYLQPKYSLKTNKMVGSEALVRWIHPEKGMISPGRFIPVFESNGYIVNLDHYMWEEVCILLKKWKDEGKKLEPVSVNISRLSMYGTTTVEFLKNLIKKYEIDPKYLELELTESAYMDDPEEMKTQMNGLRDAGFTILLDDFGSGYSSLNALRELPVDVLKLDMKFLPIEKDDVRGGIVVSSIVEMSNRLKLNVIAEGVETKEQADFLRSIHCECVQGFLFARPMPAADFEKLLEEK